MDMSEIENLVQAMHDSLCQCGGWCKGAERDHLNFEGYVSRTWGSTYPLENYLKDLRDGSTSNQ